MNDNGKHSMSRDDALGRLRRNGVKLEEVYTERDGERVVSKVLIKPSIRPGLKVLTAIDALTNWIHRGFYEYHPQWK